MTERASEGGTGESTTGLGGLSVPLGVHVAELRKNDLRFNEERDRRYSEVAAEREKALAIKEEADKAALGLAREIQTYKDEKANELRAQIESERGLYPTKDDLTSAIREVRAEIKPFAEYVTAQQGLSGGLNDRMGYLVGAVAVAAFLVQQF